MIGKKTEKEILSFLKRATFSLKRIDAKTDAHKQVSITTKFYIIDHPPLLDTNK